MGQSIVAAQAASKNAAFKDGLVAFGAIGLEGKFLGVVGCAIGLAMSTAEYQGICGSATKVAREGETRGC